MFKFGMRRLPVEYYYLQNPRGEGPEVGYLADRPIAGRVADASGHRYHYVGLAPRARDGRLDVTSLRPGEWIVEPGLVYAADDPVEASL